MEVGGGGAVRSISAVPCTSQTQFWITVAGMLLLPPVRIARLIQTLAASSSAVVVLGGFWSS
jgi:hypothetical protein